MSRNSEHGSRNSLGVSPVDTEPHDLGHNLMPFTISRSPSPSLGSTLHAQTRPSSSGRADEEQAIPLQQVFQDEDPDTANKSTPVTHITAKPRSWTFVWRWELLAATFSVACMTAVVSILAVAQDKPLRNWRFPIQPNSLVSIFSTLSNFSLLLGVAEGLSQLKWIYFQERRHRLLDFQIFDEASRGPLGSIRLLLMLKLHAVVASIGAVVTVVSLAMDPFTQQVLAFPVVTVNASNASTWLPVANAYDYNDVGTSVDSTLDYNIVAGMTNAAFTGMFSNTTKVDFQCPSGNCTWPEYTTLAICNTCQTVVPVASCTGMNVTIGVENCTYTFPDGNTIDAYASLSPGPQALSPQQQTILNVSAMADRDKPAESITNIYTVSYSDDAQDWHLGQPRAHACEMTWCQHTYSNSSVVQGTFNDTPTATQALTFLPCQTVANSVNTTRENVELCPGFPAGTTVPDWPVYNETTLQDPSALWLDSATAGEVAIWMQAMYTLSLSSADISSDDVLKDIVAKMLFQVNDGNITQTFDNVASALTNAVRQGPNSTHWAGTTQTMEPFVRVRWVWLSLPLGLVVFGVSFLAVAIAFSTSKGRYVWKSSSLATVFHRLEGIAPAEAELDTDQKMKNAARGIRVILGREAGGRIAFVR